MRRLALLCCLISLVPACYADDVKTVLKDMKTAYASIKSAKVTLELTMTDLPDTDDSSTDGSSDTTASSSDSSDSSDPEVVKFDYAYASPNKERMTVSGKESDDNATIILVDDKVVWSSTPMDDDSSASDSDSDKDDSDNDAEGSGMPMAFFGNADAFKTDSDGEFGGTDLAVHDERWNDKNWTVIQETYSDDQIIRRFYVDPETHLVWRVTDSSLDGDKIESDFEVKDIELNPKLDESLFKAPK